MSQLNESPIITIERRKAVTIIISAIIIAIALGGGLTKVGSGFAARNNSGITVTGSAKVSATADNAVWTLNVQASTPKVGDAISKVGADVLALTAYLTQGGIPADALTLGSVSTYANHAEHLLTVHQLPLHLSIHTMCDAFLQATVVVANREK